MEDARDLEALVVDLIKRNNVNIPPYPVVAMRLQNLVGSEDFGMGDLQRVIGGDPVLAATILRYANSAAFRGSRPRRPWKAPSRASAPKRFARSPSPPASARTPS